MPRSRSRTARDDLRAEFVDCYNVILEQKDVLITVDDPVQRKTAADLLLAAIVSTRSSLLMTRLY
jgi:hypothetical protein